ncbi:MAG: TonB-dependent receptor [Pseudomonadota bacterium]
MYRVEGRSRFGVALVTMVMASASNLAVPDHADAQVALEGIVIESGTLSGERIDATTLGNATTVITGEELERRQFRNVAEALRSVAGLDVSRTGGIGGLTNIRIRGGETKHVLVLIDGVEVNLVDFGAFDFSILSAEDVERIEIIRGPQSGLYGANALSGVVNIITRKGADRPTAKASAEGGSLDTGNFTAGLAIGNAETGYLNVTGVRNKTDGFNFSQAGFEDDASIRESVIAKVGGRISPFFRIDLMGRYQSNDADIDSDTDFDGRVDDLTNGVNMREQGLGRVDATIDLFNGRWQQKFSGDVFQDTFDNETPGFSSTNDTGRQRAMYLSTFRFGDASPTGLHHVLSGLIEFERETFQQTSDFGFGSSTTPERTRTQKGYALEYKGNYLNQFFLTANVRYDDSNRFEDFSSYRISGAYKLNSTGTRFHASVGTGRVSPNFFQQFGFTLDFVGNPDLGPEESFGWDVGIEQAFWQRRGSIDITYFNNNLTNEITGVGNTVVNQPGTSERQGIELTLGLTPIPGVSVAATYTYLDATDPDGRVEIRRPKHSASLNFGYRFMEERASLNLGLVYNGEMEDDDFGAFPAARVLLDEYTLVRLAGSYQLNENLQMFGRIENLLDADYEEVFSYSSQPFTAYVGVKVKFHPDLPSLTDAAK